MEDLEEAPLGPDLPFSPIIKQSMLTSVAQNVPSQTPDLAMLDAAAIQTQPPTRDVDVTSVIPLFRYIKSLYRIPLYSYRFKIEAAIHSPLYKILST